jgi:hypothetical protein
MCYLSLGHHFLAEEIKGLYEMILKVLLMLNIL